MENKLPTLGEYKTIYGADIGNEVSAIILGLVFLLPVIIYSFIEGEISVGIGLSVFTIIYIGICIASLLISYRNEAKQKIVNNGIRVYYSEWLDNIKKYSISFYENDDDFIKILTKIGGFLKEDLSNEEFISFISILFSKDTNGGKTKNLLEDLDKLKLLDMDLLVKKTKRFIIENPLKTKFIQSVPYRKGIIEISFDIYDFLKILEGVKKS